MEKPSRMRARRLWIFLNPLLAEGGEAVASVPPDLMSRTYSGFFSVGRNRFFATADHAPSCAVLTQECCVKSCCATRLKASAATVLSSRGAVIPHVQREQHQPVKSSPSIQISFRLIHLPLRACLGLELGLRLVGINWVPSITIRYSPTESAGGEVPEVVLYPRPTDHLGRCPNANFHTVVTWGIGDLSPGF